MLLWIAVGTFVAVLGIVFGTYWAIERPRRDSEHQLRQRLKITRPTAMLSPDLVRTEQQLSSMKPLARLLGLAGGTGKRLQLSVERSGLNISVGRLVLASIFVGLLTFAILSFFSDMIAISATLAAGAALLPFMFIRYKAASRLRQFEELFPEAIDLISRALRAGHALTTGLSMVAEEMKEPVGSEFRLLYDRQNFGMPLPDSMRSMADRVPLLDVRFFVTAVLTQRESGGNLAEVLDNLSAIIRERFVIKRHVRVVSAHGRITGWVLAFLPLAIAGILMLIAPAHVSVMFTDPLGRQMIMGAIVLQIVGVLIIRRIVDVEV